MFIIFTDVSIPTNSGDGKPILLKSGQSVMVIKTQKGIYLRLSDGKIVAIRVPPGNGESARVCLPGPLTGLLSTASTNGKDQSSTYNSTEK